MKSANNCNEDDSGTLPPFLISPFGWDRSAEPRWNETELLEVAVGDTGATTDLISLEHVLPHSRRHIQPSYRFDEGLVVNSTGGHQFWASGAYRIDAVVLTSPEATASSTVPEVVLAVHDLLEGYEEYGEPNWDCYGAEPISVETIGAARQLLAVLPNSLGAPHISPGSDGTIGLEWVFTNRNLRKLFIDVGPGKVWSAYWRRTSGETGTIRPKPIDAGTEAELRRLFAKLST